MVSRSRISIMLHLLCSFSRYCHKIKQKQSDLSNLSWVLESLLMLYTNIDHQLGAQSQLSHQWTANGGRFLGGEAVRCERKLWACSIHIQHSWPRIRNTLTRSAKHFQSRGITLDFNITDWIQMTLIFLRKLSIKNVTKSPKGKHINAKHLCKYLISESKKWSKIYEESLGEKLENLENF